jgi:hypothetical protein
MNLEEIRTLHYRYVDSLIDTNWDDLVDCFAENAIADLGGAGIRKGKVPIKTLFTDIFIKHHQGKELILLVHPIITVEGDIAKGTWFLYLSNFTDAVSQLPNFWGQGKY